MTATDLKPAPAAPTQRPLSKAATWKTPIVLGVFTVAAVILFVGFSRPGDSPFVLSTGSDFFQLPMLVVPAAPAGIVISILLVAATALAVWNAMRARRSPLWLIAAFAVLALAGFLVWADAGAERGIAIPGLLVGAVSLSTPLILGALGGVLSERAGVVNIAIEGQLLAGAFVAAVVSSSVAVPLAAAFGEADRSGTAGQLAAVPAILAAAVAGVLVSMLLGLFGLKYIVDQVIVGVVLNVLVVGLTGFLYSEWLSPNEQAINSPAILDRLPIPVLSQIPVVGPTLFNGTLVTYFMYIAVPVVFYMLFKTRWGLRVRAVGEHPKAADTVGIDVNRRRFSTILIAGAIAGAGGAFFTIGSVGGFNKEVTNGAGYIALAAVIFGQWHPLRATLAALLFGFATQLQYVLSSIGSPVPGEFMRMVPYVATILAVAGFVGTSRAPAAVGKPYIKS